jgi:hypothetical protein
MDITFLKMNEPQRREEREGKINQQANKAQKI